MRRTLLEHVLWLLTPQSRIFSDVPASATPRPKASSSVTGPRLARKLDAFFVSEFKTPPESVIQQLAGVYYSSGYDMRSVVRSLLSSAEFQNPEHYFARYSWPVEYVVRLIKAVGWAGFSTGTVTTPMANMGQILFEPPDVSGWRLGTDWFGTGTLLSRMNFAATLAANQQFTLQGAAMGSAGTARVAAGVHGRSAGAGRLRHPGVERPAELSVRRRRVDRLVDAGPHEGCRSGASDRRVIRVSVRVTEARRSQKVAVRRGRWLAQPSAY